jgi:alcohol dehydrogenase
MGHDSDISLPHVPGHEFSGVVEAVGPQTSNWQTGDRVTMPFMGVCGTCLQCTSGQHHLCDSTYQPGFKRWGSYAEYLAIDFADTNLVALPDSIDFATAASLGCRFATSFRAIVFQGRVSAGQWVAVHGCGGIGLSAIMIAEALGARVIAIDITEQKLDFARSIGAMETLNASQTDDVAGAVVERTKGGAHLSVDALGSTATCRNSIDCLRKRGRHVQVGLMNGDDAEPSIAMGRIISNELQILGSLGMQFHRYPEMLAMIESGKLAPQKLIGRTITLEESAALLPDMNSFGETGIAVIDRF